MSKDVLDTSQLDQYCQIFHQCGNNIFVIVVVVVVVVVFVVFVIVVVVVIVVT